MTGRLEAVNTSRGGPLKRSAFEGRISAIDSVVDQTTPRIGRRGRQGDPQRQDALRLKAGIGVGNLVLDFAAREHAR